MRAARPVMVRAPWRPRPSWPLQVQNVDQIRPQSLIKQGLITAAPAGRFHLSSVAAYAFFP